MSGIDEDSVVLLATDFYRIFSDVCKLQEISRPIMQFINSLLIKNISLSQFLLIHIQLKNIGYIKGIKYVKNS